ncbi:PilT protein domain protein [Crinalium epipsammum PCC 9333]|uniref:PilT protein domain protein n=1 Tax=Crinalium epipsammum PCC 9333 TaxID=1173022 RepID=K9W170_9CYAN|nr:type II toxin-antitoxin system VapC family toxin [Crinalium epipsammum]AFZ14103.1 PilT protein domain protein [Crinalium epipsammum PCC 9333]
MKLLLDTHIWIWFLLGDEKLNSAIATAIAEESNELWLSPISVWETLVLGQKGKIEFQPDPYRWVKRGLELLDVREASLNNEIAFLSRQLEMKHEDPADRFLAATAVHFNLTLATVDRRLLDLEWLTTLS